ncbi:hypothetical protein CYMTET_51291 [Cymbomonas tetramitiformis]|uniref:Uncharacterized protein n=1 Tax=Cymbomonas tetramitiformis TaxID=36881 RepID=A0AAE0BLD9_9CHLO|nr:hypothetical protein CYMTET_51291 [Cymbomonas tetramitiformis]|eukprot:gene4132-5108_t
MRLAILHAVSDEESISASRMIPSDNEQGDEAVKLRVAQNIASPGFRELCGPRTIAYDTARYPLRERLVDCMIAEGQLPQYDPGDFLAYLHTSGLLGPDFKPSSSSKHFKRELSKSITQHPAHIAFLDAYRDFIHTFVGPLVLEFMPDTTELVYQSEPCIRIHPPSVNNLGKPHRDRDYRHQAGEVNFWLPLVHVDGPNSLWVESFPGRGDLKPLCLQYGQVHCFYGNGCLHKTVANSSEISRVSLDFRISPEPVFDPDPDISRQSNGRQMFFIGGYYEKCFLRDGRFTETKLERGS